jgi:serine/threonine protein kinase
MASENNNDKTSLYGGNDKTNLYGSQQKLESTSLYGSSKEEATSAYTDHSNKDKKSLSHGIKSGDVIELKGQKYQVKNIISEDTGEAVIYLIEDNLNRERVLKLYFEFSNLKEEPNPNTLERVCKISDPDILKLYDFGVGKDKYQGKYCFEIQDFARGGDLFSVESFKVKYSKSFIEQQVIPEIFNGIKKLHENKIFHCDLKPQNVFFLDKNQTDLVIGDYGSAKSNDLNQEQDLRKTSTVKGTETYLAPEQPRGIISEKNDYYSFGMVLLHLVYPELLGQDFDFKKIDRQKYSRIIERQVSSQPLIHYNQDFDRINNLIQGLTLYNHQNRFGKSELERWLKGEKIEVKYRDIEQVLAPINLSKSRSIKTIPELLNFLKTQQDWYEELIEDETSKKELFRWLDQVKGKDDRINVSNIIDTYSIEDASIDNKIRREDNFWVHNFYVKEALLMYFEPNTAIKINLETFNFFTSKNLQSDVKRFMLTLDKNWKSIGADYKNNILKIRFYLFQLEWMLYIIKNHPEKDTTTQKIAKELIRMILSAFSITSEPKEIFDFKGVFYREIMLSNEFKSYTKLLDLLYSFELQRTFRDFNNNSHKTIEEIGLYFVQNESAFSLSFIKAEKEKSLERMNLSSLKELNYKEFVFEIFKNKAETQIELVNLNFDKHKEYDIKYKYFKSINTYLQQNGITKDFTTRSENNESFKIKRGFLQPFSSVCNKFIESTCAKYNIAILKDQNAKEIRSKFIGNSWAVYISIMWGRWLAVLLAIPFLVVLIGILTHNFHVDNDFNYNWSWNSYSEALGEYTYAIYTTNTNSNIRQGPSTSYSIIGEVNQGEEVHVINTSNSKWYKVKVNGNEGYISSKLLKYSRSGN